MNNPILRDEVISYVKNCIGMVRLNIVLHKKNVRPSGSSWLSEADKYIEKAEKAIKYNELQGAPHNSIMWDNVKNGKVGWIFKIMEEEDA